MCPQSFILIGRVFDQYRISNGEFLLEIKTPFILSILFPSSDVFTADTTPPPPPQIHTIPPSMSSSSKKQHVIDELLSTERDFLDDCDVIIEDIMIPMQDRMVRKSWVLLGEKH